MAKQHKPSVETAILGGVLQALLFVVLIPFRLFRMRNGKAKKAGSNSSNRLSIDYASVHNQWAEIQQLLTLNGSAHFQTAIIQADNLFDYCLKGMGLAGQTFGERLKSAERLFPRDIYSEVWEAHKIRNRLVHESSEEIMSWEAKEAITKFEHGLKELGVLR